MHAQIQSLPTMKATRLPTSPSKGQPNATAILLLPDVCFPGDLLTVSNPARLRDGPVHIAAVGSPSGDERDHSSTPPRLSAPLGLGTSALREHQAAINAGDHLPRHSSAAGLVGNEGGHSLGKHSERIHDFNFVSVAMKVFSI
jgi:hypothetical protein